LLQDRSFLAVSNKLGVSDAVVRKRLLREYGKNLIDKIRWE